MADERPVINVTPRTPIRSSAELNAEHIKLNQGSGAAPLPPVRDYAAEAAREVEKIAPSDPNDPRPEAFAEIAMSAEEREGRAKIAAFFALPEDQQKAKVASILDRGVIHDRLKVNIPPDLHGEWVRNEPLDIDRMRTLGFWIDDTYATRRALHSDGTSANIVGDVIHMVTTRQNKKMIDHVRNEMQERSMRNPRKAIEEEGAGFGSASKPDAVIPTFSESSQRLVTAADVKAALAAADGQTRVQR